jgi:general stress protein 26
MTPALASNQKSPETVSHLISMLRDFDAATLISRSRAGGLHGRPMSIARVEDDASIWFITSVASVKVDEVAEDARTTVTLQSSARFLCLNGTIELVFDRAQIKALWKSAYSVWYAGETDPDIVLLRFTPFDAEYWDNSGLQGLKYAFQAARSYVTGQKLDEKPELADDPEAHAKLRLWDPSERSEHDA